MKIPIPKGFYEDKYSVTPREFLNMFEELVNKVEELEEDRNYSLTWALELKSENRRLEAENARLRCELLK